MTITSAAEIDPRAFRDTLGHYPTGVAVVTGIGENGSPVGMVVGSFTSISLDPPLVAFSPRKDSRTFALLRTSPTFCVNVLASDQEDICRQMATGGPAGFDGVAWEAAPSGAPVIQHVVAWIECEWGEQLEGGDHHIVLGRVLDLCVSRAANPLLFFQGGYGRFSSPSLMAASDPDLIEAVRLAEMMRADVEACSAELGVDCMVSAKVAGELVTVLVAPASGAGESATVGQRVPHIAPLGMVFLIDSPDAEVERWMRHLGNADDETLAKLRANLATVRERGFSIAVTSDVSTERRALMAEYSSPDSLPSHARRIREMIAASVDHYETELSADGTYDLYSVTVPVAGTHSGPPLAIRIGNLPQGVSGERVGSWLAALQGSGRRAAGRIDSA